MGEGWVRVVEGFSLRSLRRHPVGVAVKRIYIFSVSRIISAMRRDAP